MFLLITSSVGIVRPISRTRKPRLKEMKELALSTKEGRSLGLEPRVAWLEAFPPDPAESYQRKVGITWDFGREICVQVGLWRLPT